MDSKVPDFNIKVKMIKASKNQKWGMKAIKKPNVEKTQVYETLKRKDEIKNERYNVRKKKIIIIK
jgi:hypothetical protein